MVPNTLWSVQNANMAQLRRGLSIHSWPSGHAADAEDAIQFTELQNIDCMIEKFPLERAKDAFGAFPQFTRSDIC